MKLCVCRSGVVIALLAGAGSAAMGQLVPAGGPGTGQATISHGTLNNAGNSAVGGPAVFNNEGVLITAGNGFPILGGIIAQNTVQAGLTPNVPLTLNSPGNAPAIPGITQANTSIMGVGGGGRAGLVAAAPPFLDVGVVPGGGIGANVLGGSVDYVNGGPFLLSQPIASFASGRIVLAAAGGANFAAISIRSLLQVGIGVGVNFIPTSSSFLNDVIVRFDGAGARNDDVFGDISVSALLNPTTLTFSVASIGAVVNVVPGATVRLVSTMTIEGDPAFIETLNLDPTVRSQLPAEFIGFGSSSDAGSIMPAPSAASLLGLGGLMAMRHRRR